MNLCVGVECMRVCVCVCTRVCVCVCGWRVACHNTWKTTATGEVVKGKKRRHRQWQPQHKGRATLVIGPCFVCVCWQVSGSRELTLGGHLRTKVIFQFLSSHARNILHILGTSTCNIHGRHFVRSAPSGNLSHHIHAHTLELLHTQCVQVVWTLATVTNSR